MSTDPQMQSVAAQNALSGEKTFRTVQFAITGNPDADAVAGICIMLAQPEWSSLNGRAKQRILEFLALRFKDEADNADRNLQSLQGLQGTIGSGSANQLYPSTAGVPYTTGGSSGLPNQKVGSILPDPLWPPPSFPPQTFSP